MSTPIPAVALTKCGIGIFDMEWWEPRLALFRAVTLPSMLAAAKGRSFTWFLLLDENMPIEALGQLRQAIQEVRGQNDIRLQFVRTSVEANRTGLNCIRSVAGDVDRVIVIRIDDDDAISNDAFEVVENAIADRGRAAVISLSEGYAFNGPEQLIGEWTYRANTCNTYYYGTTKEVGRVLWNNHTKALSNAEKVGFQSQAITGRGRYFLYTFHKQGDGSYEDRLKKIESWRVADEDIRQRFGIDTAELERWSDLQRGAKQTLGLTWRRTMPEVNQIRELDQRIGKLKKGIVKTNSGIFDPSVPFLYLVYPNVPPAKVRRGNVRFKGAANPGAKVTLSATGRSGMYTELATVVADQESGEFEIIQQFKPALWKIRLESVLRGGQDVSKRWDFALTVQ